MLPKQRRLVLFLEALYSAAHKQWVKAPRGDTHGLRFKYRILSIMQVAGCAPGQVNNKDFDCDKVERELGQLEDYL